MASVVWYMAKSYNSMWQESELKRKWPALMIKVTCNQHEYDFLQQVGQILLAADADNTGKLQWAHTTVLQLTKLQACTIYQQVRRLGYCG